MASSKKDSHPVEGEPPVAKVEKEGDAKIETGNVPDGLAFSVNVVNVEEITNISTLEIAPAEDENEEEKLPVREETPHKRAIRSEEDFISLSSVSDRLFSPPKDNIDYPNENDNEFPDQNPAFAWRVAGEMDKVYEKKYTRAIADIKYLKLDQEQKILDIRDQHKAELDEMKEKMKAMEEAYRVQLDERNSELVELEDRLSTYFQANKPLKRLAECESALEKAQEEIEVLRTQKEVADEMKAYLNRKWEESQTLVDGVQKLLVTPKRLGIKKKRRGVHK
jgi:hypothetical protein